MKFFQHKHKFVCRKEIQTQLDEDQSDFVQKQFQWDESMIDSKSEYVVLDCVCSNCEVSGKSKTFPVSKLINGFESGHEGLESFLSQPLDSYAEEKTRNNIGFWELLVKRSES